MARKVPIDKLRDTISNMLEVYAESAYKDVAQLAKDFAKKGANTLRAESRSRGWGGTTGYASGWTSQFEMGRLSAQGVIYNKTVPGLPHLLEKGHAKRGGGRVAGIPHIAPVEEELVEAFEKAVREAL